MVEDAAEFAYQESPDRRRQARHELKIPPMGADPGKATPEADPIANQWMAVEAMYESQVLSQVLSRQPTEEGLLHLQSQIDRLKEDPPQTAKSKQEPCIFFEPEPEIEEYQHALHEPAADLHHQLEQPPIPEA